VADPTRQGKLMELTLAQAVGAPLAVGQGVEVLATAPRLRLRLHTEGLAGGSLRAEFGAPTP
jgi:hypothetical protein